MNDVFVLTKSYDGIQPTTAKEVSWLNKQVDNLRFHRSIYKQVENLLTKFDFVESAQISDEALVSGFMLERTKHRLFIKNESCVYLTEHKEIMHLTTIDADKQLREALGKICAKSVVESLKKHKVFELEGGFGHNALSIKPAEDVSPPDYVINFDIDYGSNFIPKHKKILDLLAKRNNQLLIFDGDPGTGKSSYVRHLINEIDTKRFIIERPAIFSRLSAQFLINFTKTFGPVVFVIEDAEDLVKGRGINNDNLPILLNLIDGIYKDQMPISFILTWNTEHAEIDPALKRKGRLSYRHKFELLPKDLANLKAEALKINTRFETPTSLADIYNAADEQGFEDNKRKLGF